MRLYQSNKTIRSNEMNQGRRLTPYKNYVGSVSLDFVNKVYYGKIMDIPLDMTYDAETLDELQSEFESTVDEYLKMTGINDLYEKIEQDENYQDLKDD